MGQIILSNCKLWAGKYDMSGKLNAIALNNAPDALDNTTFGCTAKSRKKGLPIITAALSGFFEQEPDEFFSDFSLTDIPVTIAPEPTLGGPAYSFLSRSLEYKWGGSVGDMNKFDARMESVGTKMVRGWILENGSTARIANGDGTAFNLGAVSASQYIYGAIHVTAAATAAGDTLDVIIESDSQQDFGGTPETQIAFSQVLGNGGAVYEWATPVAGAETDVWWRASWTIVDVDDPSFTFMVFVGIL